MLICYNLYIKHNNNGNQQLIHSELCLSITIITIFFNISKWIYTKINRMLALTIVPSLSVWIIIQIDSLREIIIVNFNFSFLSQTIFSNRLECLFNIQGFFCARFKVRDVVLALTPTLSPFCWHLNLDRTQSIY